MQISNDAYLAVECLVQLRSCTRARPGKTLWLARAINRSVSYTEAIMARLRRAEFVEAKKGSGGGYYLSRAAHQIYVDQVFQAFDQPTTPERLRMAGGRAGNGHGDGDGQREGHQGQNRTLPADWISVERHLGRAVSATRAADGGNRREGPKGRDAFHDGNGSGHSEPGSGHARDGDARAATGAVIAGSNQLWEDLRRYVLMVLSGVTIADIGETDFRSRSLAARAAQPRSEHDHSAMSCHPCAPQPCSPCQPCRPA